MPESSGSNDRRDGYSFQYFLEADGQPARAIVKAVAWVNGVDGRELVPLQQVIDVETLAKLLRCRRPDFYRSASAAEPPEVRVSFFYAGYEVTVTRAEIWVCEP